MGWGDDSRDRGRDRRDSDRGGGRDRSPMRRDSRGPPRDAPRSFGGDRPPRGPPGGNYGGGPSDARKTDRDNRTLFLRNLPFTADENSMRNFPPIARAMAVRVAMDKETGKPRGFCHVEYRAYENGVKL